MPVKVILNPYSNRWNSRKRWPLAEAALRSAGVDFDLAISDGPGMVGKLARKAVEDGFTTLVAAGGDGTIGEAVNAIAKASDAGLPMPNLGILPLGTANDLAYCLKIPLDLQLAANVIAAARVCPVDLCQANDVYFANNSALCIEPYVTTIQVQIGWIKGTMRYLVAAVRAILDKPNWRAKIEWDGGSFNGPISLIYVGNGPRSGGVFFMGPHADPQDGKLTVVLAYRPTRRGMFAMLPKAMKPGAGNYVESDGVQEFTATWLKIHLDNPSPAHTDGEIFPDKISDMDYHIYPGRLKVLLP